MGVPDPRRTQLVQPDGSLAPMKGAEEAQGNQPGEAAGKPQAGTP
jgi:hypothetical protein